MSEQLVSIRQIAAELGVGLPAARKIAGVLSLELGIVARKRQVEGVRQRMSCWTREEANRILQARQDAGFRIAIFAETPKGR